MAKYFINISLFIILQAFASCYISNASQHFCKVAWPSDKYSGLSPSCQNFSHDFLKINSVLSKKNSNLSFGAQAGICISTFTGDLKNTKMKTGFTTGLVGVYNSDQVIGGQIEINYVQLGTKIESSDILTLIDTTISINSKATLKNSSIIIPVMARGLFGNKAKFTLDAGFYVGFLLSARSEDNISIDTLFIGSSPDTTISSDNSVIDSYSNFDYGLAFGAGAIIPLTKRRGAGPSFLISTRYYLGITNILKKSEIPSVNEAKERNSFFEIKVGIAFPLS